MLSLRLNDDDGDETPPVRRSQSLTTAAVVAKPDDSMPTLELPPPDKIMILPSTFFQIDALDLAPLLLGKFLRRDHVVLQITEFGPGGRAYVYLCYGLHSMLNVVADKEGVGATVLIRACAPISGFETIQQRRGQVIDKPILLTRPG